MRVLFISGELIAGDLPYRIKLEGNDVKLFIKDKDQKDCLDGLVAKTNNWKRELKWVGKDGLIIFDDVNYGKDQDRLRKEGYLVVGGSEGGDRLELDRSYGQEILKSCGVIDDSFDTRNYTIETAIKFIKKNKGKWVVKQNDHNTSLNYIGNLDDGSDAICVLEGYRKIYGSSCSVSLQKKVDGVEIAIGRFFNGNDWASPSVINFEHKHLCNDDIGPLGGETGTLMWYDNNDNNKLFLHTLAKIKPHLQKINYKGYVDINCIVNEEVAYPLEVTSRFGSSTIETQEEIHISPWGEFFTSLAKGINYKLDYKCDYCVNIAITVPPFPYRTTDKGIINRDVNIFFSDEITKEDFSHIHFEGVYSKKFEGKDLYLTAGSLGYVMYITGSGKTIEEAREKIFTIIHKINIPKSFYRTDIGLRFLKKDQSLLKKWGWI